MNTINLKEELTDYGNHVVQYNRDYSLCAGCETCSMLCGLFHEGFTGHSNARIRLAIATRSLMHEVLTCKHCSDHPCYEACPRKDKAMRIDESGIVYVEKENCIGCRLCEKNCKFTPSRISMIRDKNRKEWKAAKCDLCRTRPEGPACIEYCPVRCIGLSKNTAVSENGLIPASTAGKEEQHA